MIRVDIPDVLVTCCNNEIAESIVLGRLREAGIPVKGILCFGGLERGTLTSYEGNGSLVYEWRE